MPQQSDCGLFLSSLLRAKRLRAAAENAAAQKRAAAFPFGKDAQTRAEPPKLARGGAS